MSTAVITTTVQFPVHFSSFVNCLSFFRPVFVCCCLSLGPVFNNSAVIDDDVPVEHTGVKLSRLDRAAAAAEHVWCTLQIRSMFECLSVIDTDKCWQRLAYLHMHLHALCLK